MIIDTRTTTEPRTRLYRLNVDQVYAMLNAGILPDHHRVELLGGLLVRKLTKNPPHSFTIGRAGDLIRGAVPADWVVREEKSIALGRFWCPEPGVAVVRGPDERYRKSHPSAADTALLIEVSDTTYALDRGIKWRRYAACRVAIYWIVNLAARTAEVYTQPSGRGKSAGYGASHVYGPDDAVPVSLGGQSAGVIKVKDLLP